MSFVVLCSFLFTLYSHDLEYHLSKPEIAQFSKIVSKSKGRLTDKDIDRIYHYENLVDRYAAQYNIPNWVIWGVLYTESNLHKIPGDHGVGMGLGQVRCSMTGYDQRGRKVFSWMPYLNSKGLELKVCADLMFDEDKSIQATAIILSYNRNIAMRYFDLVGLDYTKDRRLLWKIAILSYNLGGKWKEKSNPSYFYKVLYFGKSIVKFLNQPSC